MLRRGSVSRVRLGQRGRRTLLEQHHTSKPIIQIPKVDRRHAALVVQFAVDVKRLVGLDLHFADALPGHGTLTGPLVSAAAAHAAQAAALVQRRVKLVAPWRAVAVAVAVVVAQQVVAPRLLAAPHRQRLVDR